MEEVLTIKEISKSPLQTLTKNNDGKKINIRDLTYDLPLTTDDIFKIFQKNNKKIVENLINLEHPYVYDYSCPYSVQNKRYYFNQRCKGCQILYRLRKGNSHDDTEIEIFGGEKKGNKISLHSFNFFQDNYKGTEEINNVSENVMKSINTVYNHFHEKINYFCIENNKVNYISQSLIYNQIMIREKLEFLNNYMWSYICGNKIYLIKEKNTISSLSDLSSNPLFSIFHSPSRDIEKYKNNGVSKIIILTILKQLTMTFKIMSKYKFIHSRPEKDFYYFIPEPVTINKETYPLKLIIQCHDYCSVSYQDKRFFCSNIINFYNHGIPIESFDIDINGSDSFCNSSIFSEEYNSKRIIFYKIGKKSQLFLKVRNFYGIPICYQSFDFVMFLISLVTQSEFYYFREMKEYKYWKNLWKQSEYSSLEKELFSLDSNCFESVFNIVKKYHIRFDALEYFYQMLLV